MEDDFDPGYLDDFVKGIQLRDVGNHKNVQLVLRLVWVCLANLLGLFGTADGCHDIVSLLEESLEDVSWLRVIPVSSWSLFEAGSTLSIRLTGNETRSSCVRY